MCDSLTIGQVTIDPQFFAFLKGASYCVAHEADCGRVVLFGNDGNVNVPLLSAEGVDARTARRLAEILELHESSRDRHLVIWGKKKIFFRLHYDDSPLSRTLYNALADLSVPHDVRYNASEVILETDGIRYRASKHGEKGLMEIIARAASSTMKV